MRAKQIDGLGFVPSEGGHVVTLDYLKNYGKVLADVLDVQIDATLDPSAAPTDGDRYLITDSAALHTNFGTIESIGDGDIVQYSSDSAAFEVVFDLSAVSDEVWLVMNKEAEHLYMWDQFNSEWFDYDVMIGGLKPTERLKSKPLSSKGQAFGISTDGENSDVVYLAHQAYFDDNTPYEFSPELSGDLGYYYSSKISVLSDTLGVLTYVVEGVGSVCTLVSFGADGQMVPFGTPITNSDNEGEEFFTTVAVDATHFILVDYNSEIQTYEVDVAAGTMTATGVGANLGETMAEPSIVALDNGMFAIAYGRMGLGGTYTLYTFTLSTYDIILTGSALDFNTTSSAYPMSLASIDGSHVAMTYYSDDENGCFLSVTEIDTSTGDKTLVDEHSYSMGVYNSNFNIAALNDDQSFVVSYINATGGLNVQLMQLQSSGLEKSFYVHTKFENVYNDENMSPMLYSVWDENTNILVISYVKERDDQFAHHNLASFSLKYDEENSEDWLFELIGTEDQILAEALDYNTNWWIAGDIVYVNGYFVTFGYDYGSTTITTHALTFDHDRNNFVDKKVVDSTIMGTDVLNNLPAGSYFGEKQLIWTSSLQGYIFSDPNFPHKVKGIGYESGSPAPSSSVDSTNLPPVILNIPDSDDIIVIASSAADSTTFCFMLQQDDISTTLTYPSGANTARTVVNGSVLNAQIVPNEDMIFVVSQGSGSLYGSFFSYDKSTYEMTFLSSTAFYAVQTSINGLGVEYYGSNHFVVCFDDSTTFNAILLQSADLDTTPTLTAGTVLEIFSGGNLFFKDMDVVEASRVMACVQDRSAGTFYMQLLTLNTSTLEISLTTDHFSIPARVDNTGLHQLIFGSNGAFCLVNSTYTNDEYGNSTYYLVGTFGSFNTASGVFDVNSEPQFVKLNSSIRRGRNNQLQLLDSEKGYYGHLGYGEIGDPFTGGIEFIGFNAFKIDTENQIFEMVHSEAIIEIGKYGINGTSSSSPYAKISDDGSTLNLILIDSDSSNVMRAYGVDISKVATYKQLKKSAAGTFYNKQETPNTTTADGDDTGLYLYAKPNGYVQITVNGLGVNVGDGVTTADCYFSADSGATALRYVDLYRGAALFWNGSIAEFELSADTDSVSMFYSVAF